MAEEEETIGDVLSRTGALKKDEMITEVESYGLEVKSDWTKDEIMEHFEEFLTSPEEVDPVSTEEGVPVDEPLPEQKGDADLVAAEQLEAVEPPPLQPTSDVRITQSQAWGHSPDSKAP
jgi:hypothetical protein